MKKQIIATGISGLVGSRIAELLQDKYKFINFGLEGRVDITDFSQLKLKFKEFSKAKTVLHLAAFTDVTAAFKQNEDKNGSCYKVNVLGSKNITQLCKKHKKYLIHISTDFVFDGKNSPEDGYTEENMPDPMEWYGKTKYLAEEEVKNSGCEYCILRIAFPFKAKNSPKNLEPNPKLDLVREIKRKLEAKEKVEMFFDQVITPVFIDDIAKVVEKCIEEKPQGIFHCVGSASLSPYNLASKIAHAFDLDKTLIKKTSVINFMEQNPDARPRQINMSLSNKKLEKELGIKMLTTDRALNKIRKQLEQKEQLSKS